MEIRVKLMGLLREKAPPGDKLELPDGATIDVALGKLQLPAEQITVVSINGTMEREHARVLADGDELMVLAPVGGG